MKELAYSFAVVLGAFAFISLALSGITKSITVLISMMFLGALLVVLWKD